MPKKAKLYFFVISKDYFYCVPSKDVTTVDATSVAVGDQVAFKYGSLSLIGDVRFISSKEGDVLAAIKKEKKMKKKLEKSFHDDRPRESVLRSRSAVSKPSEKSDVKKTAITERKDKEIKRAQAQDVLESDLIEGASKVQPIQSGEASPGDATDVHHNSEEAGSNSSHGSSSTSSIDPNYKVNEAMKKADLDAFKAMEPNSSDDSNHSTHSPPTKAVNASLPVNESPSVNLDDSNFGFEEQTTPMKRSVSSASSSSDEMQRKKKKQKRAVSSSSSSSRSSSSSSRSSSCSSSSSESSSSSATTSEGSSSSEVEKKKKRKKRKSGKRKGKKSKKHHRHSKKSKKAKGKTVVKRNLEVFPGPNFKWTADNEGVVKVHDDYNVYVARVDLEDALNQSKSPQIFIKTMVGHVFTLEALKGSTAQGYPSRNVGKKKLKQKHVLPRIDPEGRKAILKRAEVLESERKSWRPRIGSTSMNQAFTQAVGSYV